MSIHVLAHGDRHVIEHLTLLEEGGWVRCTFRGGRKEVRALEPYKNGDMKVWYLDVNATTFNSAYFQCLLQASRITWEALGYCQIGCACRHDPLCQSCIISLCDIDNAIALSQILE